MSYEDSLEDVLEAFEVDQNDFEWSHLRFLQDTELEIAVEQKKQAAFNALPSTVNIRKCAK